MGRSAPLVCFVNRRVSCDSTPGSFTQLAHLVCHSCLLSTWMSISEDFLLYTRTTLSLAMLCSRAPLHPADRLIRRSRRLMDHHTQPGPGNPIQLPALRKHSTAASMSFADISSRYKRHRIFICMTAHPYSIECVQADRNLDSNNGSSWV